MRTLLLFSFALLALPLAAKGQVKDSLVIRFKSGDSVKIPFDDISRITFKTTASVDQSGGENSQAALAYPNPAVGGSTITFTLAKPQRITIEFLSIDGVKLSNLVRDCEAGPQDIYWNGLLGSGEALPSGTYIYRFIADGKTQSGKLTVRR